MLSAPENGWTFESISAWLDDAPLTHSSRGEALDIQRSLCPTKLDIDSVIMEGPPEGSLWPDSVCLNGQILEIEETLTDVRRKYVWKEESRIGKMPALEWQASYSSIADFERWMELTYDGPGYYVRKNDFILVLTDSEIITVRKYQDDPREFFSALAALDVHRVG